MNTNPAEKQIRFISTEETLDLRSRILRPGQPIENCQYPADDENLTFHLGVVIDAKIVSNGTFIQQQSTLPSLVNAKLPYRLRGMATENGFQRQGLGKLIIETALVELQKRNCDLLWFNARVSAEEFYKKLGFISIEDIFDIPLAGPHKVMYKRTK